ncbi:hypothetical protein GWI33_011879, partial [Rhynchophorus ferrugineus]
MNFKKSISGTSKVRQKNIVTLTVSKALARLVLLANPIGINIKAPIILDYCRNRPSLAPVILSLDCLRSQADNGPGEKPTDQTVGHLDFGFGP